MQAFPIISEVWHWLLLIFLFRAHVLEIWDGQDENAPKLGRKTGSDLPKPITSSLSDLFLRFTAGSSGSGAGYRIRVDLSKKLRLKSNSKVENMWIHIDINDFASFTGKVSCGNEWISTSCNACPTINGTIWCNNDCYLDQQANTCKEKSIAIF